MTGRTRTIVLAAVAALVAIGTVVGIAAAQPSAQERAAKKSAEAKASRDRVAELTKELAPKVRYYVIGSANTASITLQTPSGSRTEDIDVPLTSKAGTPYLEFTFTSGAFVYLSAQNKDSSGDATCRITNDSSEVIAENTASGPFAIATCTGKAR